MFNEAQEVALRNLAILGEDHSCAISLHGLTLDDAVELGKQLIGGHDWDAPTIRKSTLDDSFTVRGEIPDTKIEFTIFCLPHVSVTPLGSIRASDEVQDEEAMR